MSEKSECAFERKHKNCVYIKIIKQLSYAGYKIKEITVMLTRARDPRREYKQKKTV